jgi:hypothetical protein
LLILCLLLWFWCLDILLHHLLQTIPNHHNKLF